MKAYCIVVVRDLAFIVDRKKANKFSKVLVETYENRFTYRGEAAWKNLIKTAIDIATVDTIGSVSIIPIKFTRFKLNTRDRSYQSKKWDTKK